MVTDGPLAGRVAIVTGGASGIGLGIAHELVERGARVALFDVAAEGLTQACKELSETGDVGTYVVDVTDRAGVAGAVDAVEADLGPVHALFNNAGVIDSVSPSQMRGETWDFVIDVNLNGVYNGIQAVVPGMIDRGGGGFVVNTASFSGLVGVGSGFAYHASKFAVVGLSEALRGEVAHHDISVSVVCAGQVATSIVQNTRRLRPATAEAHTARVEAILDMAHERLLMEGVNPRQAGRSIVEGMLDRRLYLFTEGSWAPMLELRTQAIIDDLHAAYPPIANDLEGIH